MKKKKKHSSKKYSGSRRKTKDKKKDSVKHLIQHQRCEANFLEIVKGFLADGIPWCAIDRENGYLYTSQFHNVGEILQYDLKTITFLRAIPLEEKLDRIQGGSVYNGMLYLFYDAANSTQKQIIAIDPNTGSVRVEFTRYCPNYDNEAEDVCVYPMEDGSLFHVVDYDKLINANVSHYKPAEG